MKSKIIKLLAGKASKKEKIQLLLAFLGSSTAVLTALVIVVASLLLVIFIGGASQTTSTDGGIEGGGISVSEMTMQWKDKVAKEAEKNGIPDMVDPLLGIIEAETGGNAVRYPDVMQSSESQGNAPNTISDPYTSIEVGVKYFAGLVKAHKDMDVLNIIQSYNFGPGFLSFATNNYDLNRAIAFANKYAHGVQVTYTNPVAVNLGYTYRYAYGNMFYAMIVKQYLTPKSSGLPGGSSDMAKVAQAEIDEGLHVGGQKYWSWYGYGGRVEWCAVFVSYVAAKANVNMEKFAYCPTGIQNFKQKNEWQPVGVEPKDGWVIFFDWDADGISDHVGIVKSYSNGTVYTLEGNSGDSTKERNYGKTSQYIMGYGTPK
ncbi:MAG: lysozyme family protein [Enterococcus sp.]|uniref:lysozyme family protein n=1 Tax=Enterococcus TaxID=1350 RepID=UPI00133093E8|nr:lysozyme family protein [Enterococcus casseliflavus]